MSLCAPAMNAAAQQAYAAGLQAFKAGDLQGAKTQFQRASDADPNAYMAQFSMGVVQLRPLAAPETALIVKPGSYEWPPQFGASGTVLRSRLPLPGRRP